MEVLSNLDGNILLWVQENIRTDFLTPVVVFITSLGNSGAIWIAAAVAMLFHPRSRKAGILTLLALLGSLVINNMLLKNAVARPRPWTSVEGLQILISKPGGFSFPSGHTSSSFAAAVVMFKNLPRKLGVPAMVLAVMIGLSRLYVGVHYPTDVLCGALMGTCIALVVCWGAERALKK